MLNLSLTGTGKTIGGILSSRIIDAHLTVIICPLDTISNWNGEIKHVFPDSRVTIKNFNPHWTDISKGHHYILLNHEMFQQPSTAENIRQLLERYQIDLIIVDEIHRCKQRSEDPSKRRQMVLALITNAAEQNPDLHVLGMSATPVINNLKEGKSLVELGLAEKVNKWHKIGSIVNRSSLINQQLESIIIFLNHPTSNITKKVLILK